MTSCVHAVQMYTHVLLYVQQVTLSYYTHTHTHTYTAEFPDSIKKIFSVH